MQANSEDLRTISRRSFLQEALTVGVVVAGSGIAGCAPNSAAPQDGSAAAGPTASETAIPSSESFDSATFPLPEKVTPAFVAEPISEAEITSTVDTEVLIIGAGMSGVCTAASAAENGLAVTILEKADKANFMGMDVAAIEDSIHKAAGVAITKEEVLEALLTLGNWRVDVPVVRVWVNHCTESVEWLIKTLNGKGGQPVLGFARGNVRTTHTTWLNTAVRFPESMAVVGPALLDHAISRGAVVVYEAPVVQLVQNTDGAVTGAIARSGKGYVKYNASKGVVLCTGGYEDNPERLKKYMRPRDLALAIWLNTTKTNTGDGHEMGLAVGGLEDEYPHVLMTDPGNVPNLGGIRVNKAGRRFVGEFLPYNFMANSIQNQPGAMCWGLTDANGLTSFKKMWNDASSWGSPESVYKDFVDKGIKADTVEELAKKMGVPPQELVKTLSRWNEFCQKGTDEDFDVPAAFLNSIDTPPYYALVEYADALVTVSGLRVTSSSEVIAAKDGLPIKGLYAVGNVSGGMFCTSYSHNVNGVSLSRCVTFGYLLGKHLADQNS